MSQAKDEGSSVVRGKKLPLMILLPRPWAKRFPSLNWIVPRRRKGVVTQTASAFPSSIHGMELTFTSPWCPVTICLCHWALCGSPFIVVIQRFLRPLWLTPFPILIYAKGHRSLCLFSWNSGQAPPWVGRSGWTKSCLIWVSWWRYSKQAC